MADVREMIIQHVLTEDIFMRVFDEAEFHRDNIIASKLSQVAGTFYTGDTKRNILRASDPITRRSMPVPPDLWPPREAEIPEGAVWELLQSL